MRYSILHCSVEDLAVEIGAFGLVPELLEPEEPTRRLSRSELDGIVIDAFPKEGAE